MNIALHPLYPMMKYFLLNYVPAPLLRSLKRVHYARNLKSYPLEREPDIEVVRHLVSPGDHTIDIGANIGLYTKVLSGLVGEHGTVYSIEPVPETYRYLSWNIRKLGLGNVIPINKALSDITRRATMAMPRHLAHAENFYRAYIVEGEAGREPGTGVAVEAQTMDSLFGEPRRFSFVKCDVEGHELQCIRGAGDFLEKSDACWLMEVSHDPDEEGSPARLLFHELSLKGYGAWWFDGKILRERRQGDRHLNYFFMKPLHLEALRQRAAHLFERGS